MRHATIVVALAALSWAVLPLDPGARAAGKPIAVIVGASSPSTNIDLAMLRRAFDGEPTTLDGKRLIPINQPPGTITRTAFDRQLLKLEPSDVGKYWIAKRIRDEGAPPKTVPTIEVAMRVAAAIPGGITYVPVDAVNATVKVISVSGRNPGLPGYPFEL